MNTSIFALAVAAVLAAWLPLGRAGRLALAAAVAMAGFWYGVITLQGSIVLLVLLLIVGVMRADARVDSGLVFALLALAAGFGLLPGMTQAVVFGPEVIKAGSVPYERGVNLGLVAISLMLLAMHPLASNRGEWMRALRIGVLVGLLTAIPALGAGYLMGGLVFDPLSDLSFEQGGPLYTFMLIWLGGQVLTLAMEEGFFRGFLQRHLGRHLPVTASIVIAGVLFGLAHFAGGPAWIVGASIAGMGYGLAYHLAGARLEASMAAHLTVNVLHLSLFSYPMLAGVPA